MMDIVRNLTYSKPEGRVWTEKVYMNMLSEIGEEYDITIEPGKYVIAGFKGVGTLDVPGGLTDPFYTYDISYSNGREIYDDTKVVYGDWVIFNVMKVVEFTQTTTIHIKNKLVAIRSFLCFIGKLNGEFSRVEPESASVWTGSDYWETTKPIREYPTSVYTICSTYFSNLQFSRSNPDATITEYLMKPDNNRAIVVMDYIASKSDTIKLHTGQK